MKPILGTGDKFVDWRTKTNQISENVGDPDSLTTDDKSSLVAGVNSAVALLDGNLSKTTTGGTTTLTASEFSNGVITIDGTLVSDVTVIVPDVIHKFILTNETSGEFTLSVKTSAQLEGVEIEQGSSASLYCDGSTVVLVGGAGGSGNIIESELPPEDPEAGDKWIKTSTKIEYTWLTNEDLSGQWVETGAVMNTYSTLRFYEHVATEGQTSFTVAYTPGFITVYMNGYRLSPSDYVATTGTSVVLNVGASAGDELLFGVMGVFVIADGVKKSGDNMSGPLTLSGNATEDLEAVPLQQVNSLISGIQSGLVQFGTCATAGATAAKVVSLPGFELKVGAQIDVVFDHQNLASAITLNVNGTGAITVRTAMGTVAPCYSPAGCKISYVYDGTNYVLRNEVVKNYTAPSSWYRQYSDGFIEQGIIQVGSVTTTYNLPCPYSFVNYGVWHDHFYTGALNDSVRTTVISLTGFTLVGGASTGTMYIRSCGY